MEPVAFDVVVTRLRREEEGKYPLAKCFNPPVSLISDAAQTAAEDIDTLISHVLLSQNIIVVLEQGQHVGGPVLPL